jgi:hypothetical protein
LVFPSPSPALGEVPHSLFPRSSSLLFWFGYWPSKIFWKEPPRLRVPLRSLPLPVHGGSGGIRTHAFEETGRLGEKPRRPKGTEGNQVPKQVQSKSKASPKQIQSKSKANPKQIQRKSKASPRQTQSKPGPRGVDMRPRP